MRVRLHLSCPGGAQLGYGSFRLCCGSWVHGSSVHPPPPPTPASAWACVSRAPLQAGADWWPDKDQMPPSPASTAKRDRWQPEGLGGLDPALVTERPSVQPRPHPGSPRSLLQDKSIPASAPYNPWLTSSYHTVEEQAAGVAGRGGQCIIQPSGVEDRKVTPIRTISQI